MLGESDLFGLNTCIESRVNSNGNLFPEKPSHDVNLLPQQLVAGNVADLTWAFNGNGSQNNMFTHSNARLVVRKYLKRDNGFVRKESSQVDDAREGKDEIGVLGGCYFPYEFFYWVGRI